MDVQSILGHLAPWVSLVWVIDQALKIVAGITGNKNIDNIADGLGDILGKFFQKPKQ